MTSTTPIEKQITLAQIETAAKSIGVETNALRAIIKVESSGSGFTADGLPTVLFERHIFKQQLIANGQATLASALSKSHPEICNSTPGGYGLLSAQTSRLSLAASFDRQSAFEATSFGLGQLLGKNYKSLKYSSLQEFINAMYKDENSQLDGIIRFLTINNVVQYLKKLDWTNVAKKYNGSNYKINNYDNKLRDAYNSLK